MDAAVFDPYRAERHTRWRNQLARWRADAGQSALHASALVALFALLVLPLWRSAEAIAPHARAALTRWGAWFALLALSAMAWRHAHRLLALRQRQEHEWLAAQPIAERWQARRRRDVLHADWLLHTAGGSVLLALIDASPTALSAWLACATVAALLAPPLSRRLALHERRAQAPGSRLRDAGAGRIWRWQRREASVALRGNRLAHGLWALLLVPIGGGPATVLAVTSAGLVLAVLATAWSRSLAVLPQAQSWLAVQPLSGRRCLRASCVVPMIVLATASLLGGALLLALGSRPLAVALVLALCAFGGLHFACTAACRARSREIWRSVLLHFVLLLAVVQAFPPLAVLSWPLQMFWLLRRAARP